MFSKAFLSLGICFVSLFSAVAQTSSLSPILPAPINTQYSSPPVGLGSTQTARVNIVNTATVSDGTTASCTGTISFLDASGSTITSATMPFTATSGRIVTAPLTFANAGGTAAQPHVEFRAVVDLNTSTAVSPTACSLDILVEIDDATSGAVQVVLPAARLEGGFFVVPLVPSNGRP